MKKLITLLLILPLIAASQNILTSGGTPVRTNDTVLSSFDLPYKTDLIAWYHADKGITLDGDRVNSWNDLSGNNRTLSQANASYQPTAVIGVNNRVAVRFDGANDNLGTFDFYDALGASKYNWGIYLVIDNWTYGNVACNSTNQNGKQFLSLQNNNTYQASIRPCTDGIGAGWRGTASYTYCYKQLTQGQRVIIYAYVTPTATGGIITLNVNDISGTTVSGGSNPIYNTGNPVQFYLGGNAATLNAEFDIYEIIVFKNKPDLNNKAKIDRYLSSKYSVDISSLPDHFNTIFDYKYISSYGASYQDVRIPFVFKTKKLTKTDLYLIYDISDIIIPLTLRNQINQHCIGNCWRRGTSNYAELLFNCDTSKVALIVDTSLTCGYFPNPALIKEAQPLDNSFNCY